MFRPKTADRGIKQVVIENAASPNPRSPQELAEALGVRVDSIYECMSRLRRRGMLKPSERQSIVGASARSSESHARVSAPDSSTLDPQVLLVDLGSEVVLSDEDRRRVLSRIARAAPGAVEVQAIKALEDMDRQQGRQVGPPAPSSDEEQIYRAARVLECVGRKNGEAAVLRARALWDEASA